MTGQKKIKVPIDRIEVGMYVDLELSWTQHPFLFSHFKIKTQKDLDTIKSLGLEAVTVIPAKCDLKARGKAPDPAPATPPQPDEMWEEKKSHLVEAQKYRERRKKVINEYRKKAQQVKKLTMELKTSPANAIQDADAVVESLAGEFDNSSEMLTNLVNLGSGEHTFYNHNVNVTVLSIMLGSALGIKGDALRQLAMGGLLHDVGKVMIPDQIVKKPLNQLTPPEKTILQQHPEIGKTLVERVSSLPKLAQAILLYHHEYLDGSGYPKGLKDKQIPIPVRIVSICNLYDNLINARTTAECMTPKMALAVIYKKFSSKLDMQLVKLFIRTMGVYPPGTVVKLTDGSIGLVIAVNSKTLLKPELLLYNPDIPKGDALIIDLAQHDDLDIEDVLKPGDYPSRIYEYLGIEERLGYFMTNKKST
ncbi:MAG: HD domain-containing phosphohydrolase [Halopseudomonas sp.]